MTYSEPMNGTHTTNTPFGKAHTMTANDITPGTRIRFAYKSLGHTRTVEGKVATPTTGKLGTSAMTGRVVFELWMDGNPTPAVFSLRPTAPVDVVA